MTLAVAEPMSQKHEPKPRKHCEYASIKVDAALIRHLKIAAANADSTIQEIASNLLNEGLSGKKGGKIIERLPPPPREKRKASDD